MDDFCAAHLSRGLTIKTLRWFCLGAPKLFSSMMSAIDMLHTCRSADLSLGAPKVVMTIIGTLQP